MISFYVYETATGRILRTGNSSEGVVSDQEGAGETAVEGAADMVSQFHNTVTDELDTRPAMGVTIDKTTISADSTDTCTVSGVPVGAVSYINGVQNIINDGTLVITADVAGEYDVRIVFSYYLDEVFTLNAN